MYVGYLLGCKHFSVVTDHVTLTHLLKQTSDKLADRQVHWVKRLMPFAHCMSVIYRKGSINETDIVSRRPHFFHPDTIVHPRKPIEMVALWWDGEVPDRCYQSNNTALLVLSADNVSVDHDFLTKLKSAYSSCSYFADEKTRWKGHGLVKTPDGLYTYHDRLVIPRPTQDLRILLLIEYHDNDGHPNWRRLLATLLKRFLVGTNVF